jgi:hypothetical protein
MDGDKGPGINVAVNEPVIGVNVPWLPPGVISVNTTEAGVTPVTVICVLHPTLVVELTVAAAPGIEINVNELSFAPGLQNVNVWNMPPGKQITFPLMGTLLQSILQSWGEGDAPSTSIITPTASGCNKTLKETQRIGLVASQQSPSLCIMGVVIVSIGALKIIGMKGTLDWHTLQFETSATVITC